MACGQLVVVLEFDALDFDELVVLTARNEVEDLALHVDVLDLGVLAVPVVY